MPGLMGWRLKFASTLTEAGVFCAKTFPRHSDTSTAIRNKQLRLDAIIHPFRLVFVQGLRLRRPPKDGAFLHRIAVASTAEACSSIKWRWFNYYQYVGTENSTMLLRRPATDRKSTRLNSSH